MLGILWYRRVQYQHLHSQSTFLGAEDWFVVPVPFCSLHSPSWGTSMAIQSSSPLCPTSLVAAGSRPDLSGYQMQVLKNKDFARPVEFTYELHRTVLAYFLSWLFTRFCWRFKSSGGHCILRVRYVSCCM